MNSKFYKYCAVPLCDNTTIKTPQKLFIYVPTQKERRKHWFRLARRAKPLIAKNVYYCEDHFDLPNDMDNFMEYHIKGSVSQIRMKPDCEPTKFDCQPNRKRGPSILKDKSRPSTHERQNRSLIEDCVKDKDQNQSFAIQSCDEDNEVPPECSGITMKEKRKPNSNWTPSEKNLLIDILQNHMPIIENEKTDRATNQRKTADWIKIRDMYNAQTKYPDHAYRTAKNLKAEWECIKKAVIKNSVQNNLIQTDVTSLKVNMDDDNTYKRVLNLIEFNVPGSKETLNIDVSEMNVENQNTISELTEEYGASASSESQDIGHFTVVKVESTYDIDTSEIKAENQNTFSEFPEEYEALEPQYDKVESPLSASTLSTVSIEDYNTNKCIQLSEQPFITNNLRVEESNNCMPKSIETNKLQSSNFLSGQTKHILDLNIQIKEEELKIKKEELKIKKEEVKQKKLKTRLLLLDLKLKRRMLVRDQVH